MRFESINTQYTVDGYQVAFNIDDPEEFKYLTESCRGKIKDYVQDIEILKVTLKGSYLIVKKTAKSTCHCINPINNEDINIVLSFFEEMQRERQEKLDKIKKSTGLPLDSDSPYDDPDFPTSI